MTDNIFNSPLQGHGIFNDTPGMMNGPNFDQAFSGMRRQPGDFTSGAIKSVRVISCNFVEMVEQGPVGFRPFISKVTDTRVLDSLPQFVQEQRHGANFKSESFNPIVNDIIGLSANSLGSVNIVNGWGIRRYSFTIMCEVVHTNNSVQSFMIEGFTDTPEIITKFNDVIVDPNMILYVNNVTSFGKRTNLHNGIESLVPVENYNVIGRDAFDQNYGLTGVVTQRPYDITNMSLQGLLAGNTSQLILDARASVAAETKTSTLANNNPGTYIARIVNDGINAISGSNTESLFNTQTVGNMLSFIDEPSLTKNGFLKQLGKVSTDYPISVSSFSWKDLTVLDPALANPSCPYLNVTPADMRDIFLPSTGLMCDDFNGSGNEQVFASMIANGISDIMSRCNAVQVNLMASNHTGVDKTDVIGLQCYNQAEAQFKAPIFEQLFEANVLRLINQNTNFAYNVAVTSSVWGETYVKIDLGFGTYTFLYPNFANGMWAPILTNDKASTEKISQHLLTVANNINEIQLNQKFSQPQQGFSGSRI